MGKKPTVSAVQKMQTEKIAVTPEMAIADIRRCRDGKLFIGNSEYIDFLLTAYDQLLVEVQTRGTAIIKAAVDLQDAKNTITDLEQQIAAAVRDRQASDLLVTQLQMEDNEKNDPPEVLVLSEEATAPLISQENQE